MLSCAAVSQLRLLPKSLATRRYPIEMINAVINKETGDIMEYRHILKNPKYRELYCKSYSKELGWIAQGLPRLVEGTSTIFLNQQGRRPHIKMERRHVWT